MKGVRTNKDVANEISYGPEGSKRIENYSKRDMAAFALAKEIRGM